MAGQAVDQRLPHAERVVLGQHVVRADDLGSRSRRSRACRPAAVKWMRWRGTSRWYQRSPEPGLEAGQVRHADEQRPAGRSHSAIRSSADPGSSRCSRTCQTVIASSDPCETRRPSSIVAWATGTPIARGGGGAACGGLDPARRVAGAASGGDESAAAGPDIEQPGGGRTSGASMASRWRSKLRKQRAASAGEPRCAAAVGAGVVEVRRRAADGHRGPASAAAPRARSLQTAQGGLGCGHGAPSCKLAAAGRAAAAVGVSAVRHRGRVYGPYNRVQAMSHASSQPDGAGPDRDGDPDPLAAPRSDARSRRPRLPGTRARRSRIRSGADALRGRVGATRAATPRAARGTPEQRLASSMVSQMTAASIDQQLLYESRVRIRQAVIAAAAGGSAGRRGCAAALRAARQGRRADARPDHRAQALPDRRDRRRHQRDRPVCAGGDARVSVRRQLAPATPSCEPCIRWLALVGGILAAISGIVYAVVIAGKANDFVSPRHADLSGGEPPDQHSGLLALPFVGQAAALAAGGRLRADRAGRDAGRAC